VSTIELPPQTINITPVNWWMPIQVLTRISAKQILRLGIKEEKVGVILEHLRDW